ncbi:hypothetical protein ACFWM0_00020 [Streptomyces sp. NPDC058405]|uniref:hypothetical protein n=1 Tax=Streptomyces sp. NPDC058405 TaxID=3346482 RepID=UPI00364DB2D1
MPRQSCEREARRPACADCGAKFTDDRWKAAEAYPKPRPRWHPALCDPCEKQTLAADQQADNERQEQDQIPEQKAGGWLSRLRT